MKAAAFGISLAVFCLGLMTVIGYLLGMARLYQWDDGSGMAINTGIGFMLTGANLAILSSRPSKTV